MASSSAFFAGAATSSLNHQPNALLFNVSTIKPSPSPASIHLQPRRRSLAPFVRASDPSVTAAAATSSGAVAVLTEEEEVEAAAAESKIGAKVRVKVPLKVYHVPKVPEVDLEGREGTLKQYVGVWKGKRISANLPFKVEFFEEVEGRGQVKFVAHLKEDEFEYL